jgi:hypothetical protein
LEIYEPLFENINKDDSDVKMPPYLSFSEILLVDNKYACYSMNIYLSPGSAECWVLLKKNEKNEWNIKKKMYNQAESLIAKCLCPFRACVRSFINRRALPYAIVFTSFRGCTTSTCNPCVRL